MQFSLFFFLDLCADDRETAELAETVENNATETTESPAQ